MRKLLVGLATGLAVVGLACSGGGTDTTKGPGVDDNAGTSTSPDSHQGSKKAASGHSITFEVTGDGVDTANNITYGVGGNSSQDNGASLPWKKSSTAQDSFLMVDLVAQSGSDGNGSISCKITVDGKVLVENTSRGSYAVVTCNGSK